MELLVARRLAVRRVGAAAEYLFQGVDLRLAAGNRVGLVGPNGSGKTTLLRLLALETLPDEGTVVRAPGTRTALLDQDAGRRLLERAPGPAPLDARTSASPTVWEVASTALSEIERIESAMRLLEGELASQDEPRRSLTTAAYDVLVSEHELLGGYGSGGRLREVLAALGFGPHSHGAEVALLSDGELQRLALAMALATPVDVVLLDEPTNHLDLAARAWLERHLNKRQGATVVVSHDRALLDSATNRTAFLGATGLSVVASSYGRAAKARAASESHATRRRREMENEAARLEKVAEELAMHGAKAQARRRRAAHDGSTLRTRAHRLALAAPHPTTVRLGTQLRGPSGAGTTAGAQAGGRTRPGTSATRGLLLEAEHLTVAGLLDDVAVRIEAGDRIALLGPNGSGKSTLLALVAGGLAGDDPRQRLWYAPAMKLVSVDQRTRGLVPGIAVVDQGSARLGLETARRVLAAAGLPYAAWARPPDQLSGGERARVGLALALAQPFDLLLLDEPDNDLDLAAVEALEASLEARLAETGAALVIATHDRRLAGSVAERVWTIADMTLAGYGSVGAYLRGDAAVPAQTFWGDTFLEDPAPRTRVEGPGPTQLDLEAERDRILERLTDPLALGAREQERLTHQLHEVESALMSAYEAALAPAAPRYRLVERGLTLYADARRSPHDDAVSGPAAGFTDLLVVAAVDTDQAVSALAVEAAGQPTIPWLDVRLVGDLAHLRIGALQGACVLPTTAAALVDAGTRLAFTVMGARGAQLFSHDDLAGTMLDPVGDGWWRLSLDGFLALEGWAPLAPRHDRTGGAGSTGSGRRRRRKVVSW